MITTLLFALQLTAPPADPVGVYHGRQNQTNVAVPRLSDSDIKIDGVLNEAAWSQSALLTGFSQFSPVDGAAAEDSTEVFVWYADHAMYIGVRAYEPHGSVRAALADRDRIHADDHITLL